MFKNFVEYMHSTRFSPRNKASCKFADGSSYECECGDQFWYLNGELHRTDGPAVIYPEGDQYWYLNDKVHRTDGPAVIYPNGDQYWYLNDTPLTEKQHAAAVKKMKK